MKKRFDYLAFDFAFLFLAVLSISIATGFWPVDLIFSKKTISGNVVAGCSGYGYGYGYGCGCSDSDVNASYPDGKNLYLRGNVLYNGISKWDGCYNSTRLSEYYCYNNGLNYDFMFFDCAFGCINGACIKIGGNTGYGQNTGYSADIQNTIQGDCTAYDFNCDGKISIDDATEISVFFMNEMQSNIENDCGKIANYFAGFNSSSYNVINTALSEILRCSGENESINKELNQAIAGSLEGCSDGSCIVDEKEAEYIPYVFSRDFGVIKFLSSESGIEAEIVKNIGELIQGAVGGASVSYGLEKSSNGDDEIAVAVIEYSDNIDFKEFDSKISGMLRERYRTQYIPNKIFEIEEGQKTLYANSGNSIVYAWVSNKNLVIVYVRDRRLYEDSSDEVLNSYYELIDAYKSKYPSSIYIDRVSDCSGCYFNGKCNVIGSIIDGSYCSQAGEFLAQFKEGSYCDSNYECLNDNCKKNKCTDGFFRRIFRSLTG